MGKSLNMQAREAIGKQYSRDHSSQTTKAIQSSVRTFTSFVESQYGLERIENLKTHMVESYIAQRLEDGISTSQLTRDATSMRLIAEAIDKPNIVCRTNAELGINRDMSERYNPLEANEIKISEIREALIERAERTGEGTDKALVAAHDVRAEFGVRANESFMSKVHESPEGKLSLQVLGAKGGKPRELEAKTPTQEKALEQYRNTSSEIGNANGKLIPPDMSAKQMYDYQRNTARSLGATKNNMSHMHVQRHAYTQERDRNGDNPKEMTQDLGHEREGVLNHYR